MNRGFIVAAIIWGTYAANLPASRSTVASRSHRLSLGYRGFPKFAARQPLRVLFSERGGPRRYQDPRDPPAPPPRPAEQSQYSFGEEIERWQEQQRALEEANAGNRGAPGPSPSPADPPIRYSFEEEAEEIHGPSTPTNSAQPASWDPEPAVPVVEDTPVQEIEQQEEEEEEEEIEEGPGENPYIVSAYRARDWVEPKYSKVELDASVGVLDEKSMGKRAKFIIPRDIMICKAKELLASLVEGDAKAIDEQLADDFKFIGPVVGPLDKTEFVRAYTGFRLREALPDIKENLYGFTVDPMEPNRVWWFSRSIGTHTGEFGGSISPTGARVEWPPEVNSMCFDKSGFVYRLTLGYSADRTMGNTGGLGSVFGLLNAIGHPLPFREARPWRPSARFLFFTKAMPGLRDLFKKGKDWRQKMLDKLDDED